MGGARLLPWERRTAAALHSRGRASGRKGRLMAKPWVMGERRPSPAWPGWALIFYRAVNDATVFAIFDPAHIHVT